MMECHSAKCVGTMKIVFGALVLLNAFLWPRWLGVDGWISFFAVLAVLGGLVHLLHPRCGPRSSCCEAPVIAKKSPVKKRKR